MTFLAVRLCFCLGGASETTHKKIKQFSIITFVNRVLQNRHIRGTLQIFCRLLIHPREEYVGRISVATAHVVLFLLAYGLNLWRVGLVLTFVHYLEQTLFHVARLAYFYGHSTSGKL